MVEGRAQVERRPIVAECVSFDLDIVGFWSPMKDERHCDGIAVFGIPFRRFQRESIILEACMAVWNMLRQDDPRMRPVARWHVPVRQKDSTTYRFLMVV